MKGRNLLKVLSLSAIGLFIAGEVSAQTPFKDNIGGNLGSVRCAVTAPAGVKGVKIISYASWAPAITTPYVNVPVEKAYDSLGAVALLNGTGSYPTLAGKFALIFRGGGITFVDKVTRCKAAGAIGVIIVNNIPGDPVGMGAPSGYSETIPVLMVSDVEGMAMNNSILTTPLDTVKVTLGTWKLGGTHDLGIVSRYLPLPNALNIPFSQMSGASGKVYNNHYIGGAIANYGTATETGVTVTDSVFWTAKGSSVRTYVSEHSFTIASIAPSDSIKFGWGTPYTLAAPTSAGKYEHVYSIAYSNPDDFPQDNRFVLNQMVTDSIYSKVPLDPATGKITFQSGYGPADGSTTAQALVGSVMYVNGADLTNNKYMQYALSQKDVTALPEGTVVFSHILKWTDGVSASGASDPSIVKDSFIVAGELKPVAISAYTFSKTDTSGDVLTVKMRNATNPSDPTLKVELEADAWYVLMVEVPATYYLGYNERQSSFTRAYAQYLAAGSMPGAGIGDRDEMARFTEDLSTALGTAGNVFVNYPFGAVSGSTPPTTNLFVDSIFYDRYNKIPAIALVTTPNELSVATAAKAISGTLNAFPVPASNNLTVVLNLESTEKFVEFRLFDAIGRSVYAVRHENVKNDKFDIDLSRVAPGNYHLVAATAEGLISKSIVVAK